MGLFVPGDLAMGKYTFGDILWISLLRWGGRKGAAR